MFSKSDYVTIPEGNLDEDDIKSIDEGLDEGRDEQPLEKNIGWINDTADLVAGIPTEKLIMGIG
jgi:hypothetical protein